MKQNKSKSVKAPRVRRKLFLYMVMFLAILLGLLWLLQVVFFEDIYKAVRTAEIKSTAEAICRRIDGGRDRLDAFAEKSAAEKQVCVLVFDETGRILTSKEAQTDCIIHGMSARNVQLLYSFALREGGEKLTGFYMDSFKSISPSGGLNGALGDAEKSENRTETIIYTKVIYSPERSRNVAVILNTTISPVAATVRTLQTELLLLTAFMVLFAVLLSYLLAKRLARPIVSITENAKRLAQGDYDTDFTAKGYREVTELSKTLSYAAGELAKTEKLQRELIANISHDLRTPLTMITGYAEMMRDIPGENTPENIQTIIDEAVRMTSLVNDVLDISKLQSGTAALEISEFNITETVREVIGRFSKLTESAGYSITFISDADVVVRADRTRMLQVIYNFVNNAITHSGEDKAVIVTQKITDGDMGRRVRIEVEDHGEGIAAEDVKNIFERYYKVDKHHRRAEVGSGLGLSIVKNILELHGARYGVDSKVGEGSVFWFELG